MSEYWTQYYGFQHPWTPYLLSARGINTADELEALLTQEIPHRVGMGFARRTTRALRKLFSQMEYAPRVVILGDADCDGISSAVIIDAAIRALCAELDMEPNIDLRIPARANRWWDEADFPQGEILFILDQRFTQAAMDRIPDYRMMISIDHHAPFRPDLVPAGVHIVNGEELRTNVPAAGLCFLFASELLGDGHHLELLRMAQWAAVGCVGDVGEMNIGDTRAIVRYGLGAFRTLTSENRDQRLRWLCSGLNLTQVRLSAQDIAFGIAPCLNAAPRMNQGIGALYALLGFLQDRDVMQQAVEVLTGVNALRKRMTGDYVAMGRKALAGKQEKVICLFLIQSTCELGGVVAAQLAADFGVPVGVGNLRGDEIYVSWRNPEGAGHIDLGAIMASVARSLGGKGGGHHDAAGLHIQQGAWPMVMDLVREQVLKYAPMALHSEAVVDSGPRGEPMDVPTALSWNDELMRLEPFGHGFPAPVVKLHGWVHESRKFGNGRHAMLQLGDKYGQQTLDVTYFNVRHALPSSGVATVTAELHPGAHTKAVGRFLHNVRQEPSRKRRDYVRDDMDPVLNEDGMPLL